MRSYSRNSGDTSCEQTATQPARREGCRDRLLVRGVEIGVQQAHGDRVHVGDVGDARRRRARSRGRIASRRPPTSKRRSRGTSGGGPVDDAGRRATGAPGARSRSRRRTRASSRARPRPTRCSSRALVATVVPCASTSGRVPPAAASRVGHRVGRVVGGRRHLHDPTVVATRSVNVPPVSTPIRTAQNLAHARGVGGMLESAPATRQAPPPHAVADRARHVGLHHGVELAPVAVGQLEAVDRLARDGREPRRVHVGAGTGDADREVCSRPRRSGLRTSHSVYHGDEWSSKRTSASGVGGDSSGVDRSRLERTGSTARSRRASRSSVVRDAGPADVERVERGAVAPRRDERVEDVEAVVRQDAGDRREQGGTVAAGDVDRPTRRRRARAPQTRASPRVRAAVRAATLDARCRALLRRAGTPRGACCDALRDAGHRRSRGGAPRRGAVRRGCVPRGR